MAGLSLDRSFNGSHYFLLVTGSDFGPVAGPGACPGDVVVTVDDAPCDALTMTRVRRRDCGVRLRCVPKRVVRTNVRFHVCCCCAW